MKYKLLKDLPFMRKGSVFQKGHCAGPGWGVDRGFAPGCRGPHRGITTYTDAENEILTSLMEKPGWIESIPSGMRDLFMLLELDMIDKKKFCEYVEFKAKS